MEFKKRPLLSIVGVVLFIIILFGSIVSLFHDSRVYQKESDTIKIGLLAPISGSLQSGGSSMKKGAELAVQNINENGGILGTQLELFIYDDNGIAFLSEKGVKHLVFLENVEAIIGPFSSDSCLAIIGLVNNIGIPLITPISMSDAINKEDDYVFRNTLGVIESQNKINEFVTQSKNEYLMLEGFGAKSIGILWQDDTWGSEMQLAVLSDLAKLGREDVIVFNESFALGQKSYSNLFDKYKNNFPDLIYIVSSGEESIQLVKAGRASGFSGLFYGEGGFNYSHFDTALGEDADGCLFSTQWHPSFSTPMSDVFLKFYLSEYSENPDMFAAITYEAVYVLKESLLRTKSFLPKDNYRSILRKDLSQPRKMNGITGPIFFNEYGQCDRPMFILQKKWDGRNVQSFIVYPEKYSQSRINWNFDNK